VRKVAHPRPGVEAYRCDDWTHPSDRANLQLSPEVTAVPSGSIPSLLSVGSRTVVEEAVTISLGAVAAYGTRPGVIPDGAWAISIASSGGWSTWPRTEACGGKPGLISSTLLPVRPGRWIHHEQIGAPAGRL